MRFTAYFTASVIAIVSGGCIPSTPLTEGQLDEHWTLTPDPTHGAPPYRLTLGKTQLPARWTIHHNPSVIVSTITLVRAYDKMKVGAEEIEFAISPVHTRTLIDLLSSARAMLNDLSRLAESAEREDRQYWSQTIASTLTQVEEMTRLSTLESPEGPGAASGDPTGIAAGPLLGVLVVYLNERSGGALLGDLEEVEIDRLRTILTQMVLRLGFDLAGKQVPDDLRTTITKAMRQAERMDALEQSLKDMLIDSVGIASPATEEGEAKKLFTLVASWVPRALEMMEALINQWDRMELMELRFYRVGEQLVVAVTIKVQPGKEVRIADVMMFQPSLIFRGESRITVIPEASGTGETIILFEPVEGATELRFEGVAYSMARLLALPLADGTLREVRVFTHTPTQGYRIVNFQVMTEALGEEKDRRRLMVFQDVRKRRILRHPFSLEIVEEQSEQIFNYLTPERRYTYKRSKQPTGK